MASLSTLKPGVVVGRWTVLNDIEIRKKKKYFKCLCKCGKKKFVRAYDLTYGVTSSCGCLRNLHKLTSISYDNKTNTLTEMCKIACVSRPACHNRARNHKISLQEAFDYYLKRKLNT